MDNVKFSQNTDLKKELSKAFKDAFKSTGIDPSQTSWACADYEEMFRIQAQKNAA